MWCLSIFPNYYPKWFEKSTTVLLKCQMLTSRSLFLVLLYDQSLRFSVFSAYQPKLSMINLLEADFRNILCHKSLVGSLLLGFRSFSSHFFLLLIWHRLFLLVLWVPDPLLSSFLFFILHKFLLPVCRHHRFWDQNHIMWSVTVCTTMPWGPICFIIVIIIKSLCFHSEFVFLSNICIHCLGRIPLLFNTFCKPLFEMLHCYGLMVSRWGQVMVSSLLL